MSHIVDETVTGADALNTASELKAKATVYRAIAATPKQYQTESEVPSSQEDSAEVLKTALDIFLSLIHI